MNRVFFDTAPVIYLIESHPVYMPRIAAFMQETLQAGGQFFTSPITYAEFGVQPYRLRRWDLLDIYKQFLTDFSIISVPVDEACAFHTCKLRSEYPSLKLADALQLSTAILSGCHQFLTNDHSLSQIRAIEVVLADQLPDRV
ncbi:MAG: PIN domain-containing protein [Bacteroidia bacterium]|nr:PIN domain-containing protein [Bacteroidia bacterium]